MVIRFIIVLIFAYLCFFLLMKLWLVYLTTSYRKRRDNRDLVDEIDIPSSISDYKYTESSSSSIFRGGESGGGGASGFWEPSDDLANTAVAESTTLATESVAETAAEAAGEAASGFAEEGGAITYTFNFLAIGHFWRRHLSHL